MDNKHGKSSEQAAQASALIRARKEAQSSGGAQPASQTSPRPSVSQKPTQRPPVQQPPYPKTLRQYIMQNLLYILSAIAVIAIVALVILIVAPAGTGMVNQEADAEESYVSPYDWTKLDRADGRYSYVVDGEKKSRLGIDVSENQHEIDWDAVAADGVDFAMIRLGYRGSTEGELYLDDRYQANIDGARNAGLDCGVYFFSQATTVDEAIEEADFVLGYLGDAALAYPVAFDSEEGALGVENSRTSGLSNDTMTAVADAFCSRIEAAGYRSLVYGNANELARYGRSHLESHQIWWAEYGVAAPTAKIDIVMWQYSNDGSVAGVSEPVDMNIDLSGVL